MSTATAQLPDLQSATDTIFAGVHRRAFLHKMAQHGHNPQNEAEADELVDLGFKLAAANPNNQEAGTPFGEETKFASANAELDELLGIPKQASDEVAEAAVALAQDPAIYNAALAIKVAEAQEIAATQNAQ